MRLFGYNVILWCVWWRNLRLPVFVILLLYYQQHRRRRCYTWFMVTSGNRLRRQRTFMVTGTYNNVRAQCVASLGSTDFGTVFSFVFSTVRHFVESIVVVRVTLYSDGSDRKKKKKRFRIWPGLATTRWTGQNDVRKLEIVSKNVFQAQNDNETDPFVLNTANRNAAW